MGRDPVEQDRNSREYCEKVGAALVGLGRAFEGYRELAIELTGLSIRGPQYRNGEYLIVARGVDHEGRPMVGFHSALDLGELVRGVESRLGNGTLKWRADEFK